MREKNLERVISSTSGMYGDIQGGIGGMLPKIQSLELDAAFATPQLSGGDD